MKLIKMSNLIGLGDQSLNSLGFIILVVRNNLVVLVNTEVGVNIVATRILRSILFTGKKNNSKF